MNIEDKALCFSERNLDQNSFRKLKGTFNLKQMATRNDFYQNSSWKSKWLHLFKDKSYMHTVHKRVRSSIN